jgi:surfeit locus 1 family protein
LNERPFWLRPKWVVGHIVCLALIIAFINLGFWQLRRLHGKRERNHLIHEREAKAPTTLDDALSTGPDGAVYRRVRVEGTWDAKDTVLVRSRSLDGESGYHVLTPLVVGNEAIIVNRGFAPSGGGGEPAILATVRPKSDFHVRIEGLLRASEKRGSFGPRDPASGRLTVINRLDIPRLQEQIDLRLVPVYLQRQSSVPPEGDLPRVLPMPATDEGPHLSYAVQWFIFATVGAVGWPLLLRKQSRDLKAEDRSEPDEEPPFG